MVFDLSRAVDASAFALTSPNRIVVDLPEVNFQLDPSVGRVGAASNASLVKDFRFGLLAAGKSRIVVDLAREACPAEVSTKPIVDGAPAARLTIELKPCDPVAFAALVRSAGCFGAEHWRRADSLRRRSSSSIRVTATPTAARAAAAAYRKISSMVCGFCTELKRQLDATKRYNVVMTRDGDQYVGLDDRVEIARVANASLFVSVHADILNEAADVSGSTVYTAADRASDAEAARIAARENAADGGPGAGKRIAHPDVADILFDLKRRETRAYAHIFSRGLVESLRGAAKLNHNPERSAGFVVLKAPEFPSVLIELGYLSNAQDVQALTSAEWRSKTAAAMVSAIDAFFSESNKPPSIPASDPGVALTGVQAGAPPGH